MFRRQILEAAILKESIGNWANVVKILSCVSEAHLQTWNDH